MTANIFITGGAGFIGARLADRFARDGARVTVFDNFHPQVASIHPANLQRLAQVGVQVVTGDVRDRDALSAAIDKAAPDLVYHLAAETGTGQSHDLPARYSDVNVTGTATLVEALRDATSKVGRVVLAGSRAVYGEGACVDAEGQPTLAAHRKSEDLAAGDFMLKDKAGHPLVPVATNADCPVNPASIYASTKLMQEYLLEQGFWGKRHGGCRPAPSECLWSGPGPGQPLHGCVVDIRPADRRGKNPRHLRGRGDYTGFRVH